LARRRLLPRRFCWGWAWLGGVAERARERSRGAARAQARPQRGVDERVVARGSSATCNGQATAPEEQLQALRASPASCAARRGALSPERAARGQLPLVARLYERGVRQAWSGRARALRRSRAAALPRWHGQLERTGRN